MPEDNARHIRVTDTNGSVLWSRNQGVPTIGGDCAGREGVSGIPAYSRHQRQECPPALRALDVVAEARTMGQCTGSVPLLVSSDVSPL